MHHAGVLPGMHRTGHHTIEPCSEAFAECACALAQVPVERFGEQHALCGSKTHTVDVVDQEDQSSHFLTTLHDAEFGGLFDAIHGVIAAVRQADRLRTTGLCLHQERREVRCAGEWGQCL